MRIIAGEFKGRRILFRVAQSDIEAYASEKIDLDTLKKRVAITEM